jgi:hypothetical protein
MAGVLEDLFRARTDRNTNGTISGEWDRILLQRELERLIAEGVVDVIDCSPRPDTIFRERRCFRDVRSGEVYLIGKQKGRLA